MISYCFLQSFMWLNGQSNQNLLDHFSFVSPVKHNYKLSGNFCELRNSHFHGGLDIKQSGTGKDTIFSIGDGYISRIRISPGGYGQALYIDHPESGLTSVYAHLDKFNDAVSAYVQQEQIAAESYDMDLLLSPDVFPVHRGQYIGNMGNTGHSFGKHLHFEIRETATEKALNPFLVGFGVVDNIPPSLLKISIHGLDDHAHKIWERSIPLHKYSAKNIDLPSIINVPTSQAGIAINAFDRTNGSQNKQGIYAMKLYVNDSLRYNSRMDKLPFDQSKYLKGFVDFSARLQRQETLALCYRYPGQNLALSQYGQDGIISISPDTTNIVVLEVEDYAGNSRSVKLRLQGDTAIKTPKQVSADAQLIQVNTYAEMQIKGLNVFFEPKSLYRNIHFELDTIVQVSKPTKYKIHDRKEPLKHPLKISIKPDVEIAEEKMSKAIIIRENAGRVNCGGAWQDSLLETRITEFGVYTLGFDTVAPAIRPINFLSKASKLNQFRFRITDNLPIINNGFTEPLQIKVWIDDVFHICAYDLKSHTLTIPIKNISSGKHELKIEVRDYSDNVSYFNAHFYR